MGKGHAFVSLTLVLTLAAIQPASAGEWISEEGDHFIIYYHEGYEQQANSLMGAHENCYAFVMGFIGYRPPTKIEIYLCSTPGEFVEVGNTPPEAEPAVGTSAGQWSNGVLSYYNTFGGPGVTHEFVHAVESQFLTFERPRWWVEGLACYLTYKFTGEPGPGSLYQNQLSDFTSSILYNNPPFRTLSELEGEVVLTKFGYETSTSVFLYIEENYGESKVKEIIQTAANTENIHSAFQAALGISFQAFQSEWHNSIVQGTLALAEAQSAVGTAERDGRTVRLEDAKARLSEAVSSFNRGKFLEARAKAEEAENLAAAATVGAPEGLTIVILGAIIMFVVAVIFVVVKRKK